MLLLVLLSLLAGNALAAPSVSVHVRSATLYTDEATFLGATTIMGGLNTWDAEVGDPGTGTSNENSVYTTTTFPDITISVATDVAPSADDLVVFGSGLPIFGGSVGIGPNGNVGVVYSFAPAQTVFGARVFQIMGFGGGNTAEFRDASGNLLGSAFTLTDGANFIGIDCPVPVASLVITGDLGEVLGPFYVGGSLIGPSE
jgi:hypothetical protein